MDQNFLPEVYSERFTVPAKTLIRNHFFNNFEFMSGFSRKKIKKEIRYVD